MQTRDKSGQHNHLRDAGSYRQTVRPYRYASASTIQVSAANRYRLSVPAAPYWIQHALQSLPRHPTGLVGTLSEGHWVRDVSAARERAIRTLWHRTCQRRFQQCSGLPCTVQRLPITPRLAVTFSAYRHHLAVSAGRGRCFCGVHELSYLFANILAIGRRVCISLDAQKGIIRRQIVHCLVH